MPARAGVLNRGASKNCEKCRSCAYAEAKPARKTSGVKQYFIMGVSFFITLSDKGYVSMIRNQGCIITKNLYGINIYIRRSRLPVERTIPCICCRIRSEIAFLEYNLSPAVIYYNGWDHIQSDTIYDEMIVYTVTVW